MGKHHQRAKRYKHDETGAVPSSVKEARGKIIEGRRNLDALVAFEGFQLLAAQKDIPLPVDLVTTVLSVFVESKTLPGDVGKLREHANEIYTTTLSAHQDSGRKQISEAFYSTSMRVLLRLDDFASALKVVKDMTDAGHSIRHRSYAPLLAKACEQGDMEQTKSFYREMASKENMLEDEDSTVVLEALAAKAGSDREFALEVLQASETRATSVPSARFVSAAAAALGGAAAALEFKPLLDSHTCAHCQQQLRSVDANEATVLALIKDTASLAPTQNDAKRREWEQFLQWEQAHLAEFDCIVDGANMAYFRSSAPGTDHDEPKYEHADVMMDHLVAQGRKPLLFFHARHFKHNGIPKPIVSKWKAKTYIVPHGHNDDVFWLYFALRMSVKNPQAWLITNDQMRDHKFEMINTSSAFARWRERHQVAYDFIWDARAKAIVPGVFPPLPYSVQVQHTGSKWHFPQLVPSTAEDDKLAKQVEELKKLPQPDLRRELQSKAISFDLFRQVRAEMSGCEKPKTTGKSFVWACV